MLQVVELLGSLIGKLLGLRTERKKEVAAFLDSIADQISKFPQLIRANAPMEQLAECSSAIRTYGERFTEVASDVLTDSERSELVNRLDETYNAKQLLMTSQDENKQQLLTTLSESAGAFRAYAGVLRATASQLYDHRS
jgi:hypothetical protein